MSHDQVTIRTRDGECPVHVLTPDGEGRWPATILYMDAFAIRPTLVAMAARLAEAGYVMLLPDLFYRLGSYDAPVPAEMQPGDFQKIVVPMMASTDNRRAAEDSAAFLDHLDGRGDVAGDRVGVFGYCMGGGVALTVAGAYPGRVVAAASFHGGNLATDAATSPHLSAPAMQAEIYVAGADHDNSYPPEMAERIEKALDAAGVRHRCEIYAGVRHGWTMRDLSVYDEAAAERAWAELLALFARNLR